MRCARAITLVTSPARLAAAAVALAVLLLCAGCGGHTGKIAVELTGEYIDHGAWEPTSIYPAVLVKERVIHEPHEAARFGEWLRRERFASLRMSAQNVAMPLQRDMSPAEVVKRGKESLQRHIASNPLPTHYGLVPVFQFDTAGRIIGVYAFAAEANGAFALALALPASDPKFTADPADLSACEELLARTIAEQVQVPPAR